MCYVKDVYLIRARVDQKKAGKIGGIFMLLDDRANSRRQVL